MTGTKTTTLLVAGLATLAVGLLPLPTAQGQSNPAKLKKVPIGAVAASIAGRLVGGGGFNGEYELIAYYTFIEGLGVPPFAGNASERTALFTLRTDRVRFQSIPNGPMFQFSRLVVPGADSPAIRLYYQQNPNRDFSRPDSFSEGQLVATLRSRGLNGGLTPSLSFRVEGTVSVESAEDFSIGDRTINLRSLIENVTVSMVGVPPSLAEFTSSPSISVPLSGTITAARRFRQ